MSKRAKHLEEIIDRIIDFESFEIRVNIIIDRIRNGLDELKIMKMDTKKTTKKIGSELMSLKEKERMARFKIEEIK